MTNGIDMNYPEQKPASQQLAEALARVAKTQRALDVAIEARDQLSRQNAAMRDLLKRAYDSGHRKGWEPGESVGDCMNDIHAFLCNIGADPALAPNPTTAQSSDDIRQEAMEEYMNGDGPHPNLVCTCPPAPGAVFSRKFGIERTLDLNCPVHGGDRCIQPPKAATPATVPATKPEGANP